MQSEKNTLVDSKLQKRDPQAFGQTHLMKITILRVRGKDIVNHRQPLQVISPFHDKTYDAKGKPPQYEHVAI